MSVKCIASGQKGGVGKSTLAILTSEVAPALGIRLGVVDLAMGNPSTSVALLGGVARHTVATYVVGASRINEVINVVPTRRGPVYLAPSGRGDLSLVRVHGDLRGGVKEIIDFMLSRLSVDYVVIDFPAFEPSIDEVFSDVLSICDVVYPVGIQDPGSLMAMRNLVFYARRVGVDVGVPVINLFREALGGRWVGVVGKLVGREPSVIHYDPWLIRFAFGDDVNYGIGVKDALEYIVRRILR
nr:MAG: hypothetical protein TU36_02800 [Vulcanisaeta sp. AZ3]